MSTDLDMMQARGKWAAKVVKAQAAVETVVKDKRNDYHKYDYASAEAIFSMLRPHISAAGLALMANTAEHDLSTKGLAILSVDFSLVDSETGYSETVRAIGEGQDSVDKRIPKAYTAAAKSWARVMFLLDFEDAEQDEGGQKPPQGKPQPPTPVKPQPAPAQPRPQAAAPSAPAQPAAPANGGIFTDVIDIPDTLPTGASKFLEVVNAHRARLGHAPYEQPVVLHGLLKRDMPDGFDWGMLKDPGAARVAYRIAVEHIRASEAA